MALGTRIQKRLAELNWSQVQLCKCVPGLSPNHLNSIIRKDYTSTRYSEAIAKALGIDHDELVFRDTERKQKGIVPTTFSAKVSEESEEPDDDTVLDARRKRLDLLHKLRLFSVEKLPSFNTILSGYRKIGSTMAGNMERLLNFPNGYIRHPLTDLPLRFGSVEASNVDKAVLETVNNLAVLIPLRAKPPKNLGKIKVPAALTVNEILLLDAYRKSNPQVQAVVNDLLSYTGSGGRQD
jgi:lambda repressor-like predicted transcriptional regulator